MVADFALVFAILTTESSYAYETERTATTVPDTVQFWFTPDVQWRVRTYAIDHDIHPYTLDGRPFTADAAEAHIKKHYADVLASVVVLTFRDPNDKTDVQRILDEHKLTGTLEVGKNGVAFYNPDRGEYRSKSQPK